MIRQARWPAVATLVVIALIGFLTQPVALLRVTTYDGAGLVCWQVGPGDTVTLVFTHSMYGGEVRETWRVDGERLARVGIETDNAAAAEYYATDGEVRRVEGGFDVVTSPFATEALVVRIDRIGNHRVRFGADELSLADRVDGSAGAVISVGRISLIQHLVARDGECAG